MAGEAVMTVVSGEMYQWFMPLFIYTWKKAYPSADVVVFVRGGLSEGVKSVLSEMRSLHYLEGEWAVKGGIFDNFPKRHHLTNALRHLIPDKYLLRYDQVLITDVDLLGFPVAITHWSYFGHVMRSTKLPYAAFRGPKRTFYRPEIAPMGWTGNFARLGCGTFMLHPKEWVRRTSKARAYYWKVLLGDQHDKYDHHRPGSYREYDEVMIARICTMSRLRIPGRRSCFVGGKPFDTRYRGVHLGDFKFKERYKNRRKMREIIHKGVARQYVEIQKDEGWKNLLKKCDNCDFVSNMNHRAYNCCKAFI